MCRLCENGVGHECRVTGAYEPGRFPEWFEMGHRQVCAPPYLNAIGGSSLPPNADALRQEDMNRRDHVHRDRGLKCLAYEPDYHFPLGRELPGISTT